MMQQSKAAAQQCLNMNKTQNTCLKGNIRNFYMLFILIFGFVFTVSQKTSRFSLLTALFTLNCNNTFAVMIGSSPYDMCWFLA